jgi:thioredoxin 1
MSTESVRPYVDLEDSERLETLMSPEGGAAVIDFWSPTCGPCMAMARDFEHVAGQFDPEEVAFFKVDTSRQGHLAVPFRITSVPTILFVLDGSVLDAVVGRMDARRLGERAEWLLTKKLRRAKGGLIGRLFG